MRSGRIKSFIEGPRWAGIRQLLEEAASKCNLELETETDRGWIFETVYFTVTGNEPDLLNFKDGITRSLKAYNS